MSEALLIERALRLFGQRPDWVRQPESARAEVQAEQAWRGKEGRLLTALAAGDQCTAKVTP